MFGGANAGGFASQQSDNERERRAVNTPLAAPVNAVDSDGVVPLDLEKASFFSLDDVLPDLVAAR